MPKALCWTGIGVAIIILVFFLLDLAIAIPFNRTSWFMDAAFVLSAVALAYLSWTTLREQA